MPIPGLEGLLTNLASEIIKKVYEVKSKKYLGHGEFDRILVDDNLSLRESRRGRRQFAAMVDSVTDKLQPLIEVEFDGLPSNEASAAIALLQDILIQTELKIGDLVEHDMEPVWLEAHVRELHRGRIDRALLSLDGSALFDLILRETCNYIIEISMSLPEFGSRSFREMLTRETALIELIEETLERLPAAVASTQTSDADFELKYRRAVVRRLDKLELFGVNLSEHSKRYALDVAYISLSANQDANDGEGDRDQVDGHDRPSFFDLGTKDGGTRIDAVISNSERLLVRGDAGSGKTTLLQWLAVSASRGTFAPPLDSFNSKLPFFVPLRQFSALPLPGPKDLPGLTAPSLEGRESEHWVYDVLEAGRAIILVDGLDEVPPQKRAEVRNWLHGLVDSWPGNFFLITSRPTAVDDSWPNVLALKSAELLPMARRDVDVFVRHWHQAVKDNVGASEHAELERLQEGILRTLSHSSVLMSLATSPLLCALLCALNRDRRASLPHDRMELYRIALETLLDRRDIERQVFGDIADLTLREKHALLQDLAFWLMLNSQASAPKSEVVNRCRLRLDSMPHLNAPADEVVDHLILRSGVLREPVVGEVDFVHRTFQEYLAAREAVNQGYIPMLLANSKDDQWRETIVLACGHGTPAQRAELIGGLLDLGDENPQDRNIYHLLAVACLETAEVLDAPLAARIRVSLQGLVPPSNMTQAKSLAVAGELAVANLSGFPQLLATEAAATVRTLAMIGTEAALSAIAEYGSDHRVTVQRELLRAWSAFDTDSYARQVLRRNLYFVDTIEVTRQEEIDALHHLKGIAALRVLNYGPVSGTKLHLSLHALAHSDQLSVIYAISARITEMSELSRFLRTRSLTLASCDVDDLSSLQELPDLRQVRLSNTDCHSLYVGSAVTELVVNRPPSREMNVNFTEARSMEKLALGHGTLTSGLPNLDSCNNLRQVTLANLVVHGDLSLSPNLTWLDIRKCSIYGNRHIPTSFPSLNRASLLGLDRAVTQELLAAMKNVHSLNCDGEVLNLLGDLEVDTLAIQGNRIDISRIPTSVKKLCIYDSDDTLDLSALLEYPDLELVILVDCPGVLTPDSKAPIPEDSEENGPEVRHLRLHFARRLGNYNRLLSTLRLAPNAMHIARQIPSLTVRPIHGV